MTDEEQHFLEALRAVFPDQAKNTDISYFHKWEAIGEIALSLWLEDFAHVTNILMNQGEEKIVQSLFDYIDKNYQRSSPDLRKQIDVGYVENLFWKTTEQGAEMGWSLLSLRLQKLYINFHGRSPVLD